MTKEQIQEALKNGGKNLCDLFIKLADSEYTPPDKSKFGNDLIAQQMYPAIEMVARAYFREGYVKAVLRLLGKG